MGSDRKSEFALSSRQISTIQEAQVYQYVYDGDDVRDVADMSGATPLTELIGKEEAGDVSEMEAKEEAIGGLLWFLFQPVDGCIPSVNETAVRLWTLCYSLRPDLINGMTLKEIADLFSTSRQTMSKRVLRNDEALGIRARNRKSDTARSIYAEGTRKWHQERKAREREEREREYQREYRAKHREKRLQGHREYYQKNKARLLEAQRNRRLRDG